MHSYQVIGGFVAKCHRVEDQTCKMDRAARYARMSLLVYPHPSMSAMEINFSSPPGILKMEMMIKIRCLSHCPRYIFDRQTKQFINKCLIKGHTKVCETYTRIP